MTQPKLLELAKQGEPQAIAILMNRSLQPQGMSVKVTREGDRLSVLLQADQTPNRLVMTNFVRNGITNLKLQSVIQSVDIIGQRTGDPQPAWVQELQLSALDTPNAFLDVLEPSDPDVATAVSAGDVFDQSPPEVAAATTADDLSSLLDGGDLESATGSDLFLEEDSTPESAGLSFEDEGLEFSESSFDDLELGSAESSPDLSDLGLGGEADLSFDLDEDPSGFSTLDLDADLTQSADTEDFSLASDLSSDYSNGLESGDLDLAFDSLDEPAASAQDWSLETTSFESLDESFGESSNDLDFGESNELDLSGFGESPTDDLDLSGFSAPDETDTTEGVTGDLGLDAFESSASGVDWSLEDTFNQPSDTLDLGETSALDFSSLDDSSTDELGFSGEFGTDEPAADDFDLGLDALSESSLPESEWSFESPSSEPAEALDVGETDELSFTDMGDRPAADLDLSGELGIHELAPDDLGLDAFNESPSSDFDWSLESSNELEESASESSNPLDFGESTELDLSDFGVASTDDFGFAGEFGTEEPSAEDLTADDLGLGAFAESSTSESEWSLEDASLNSLDESFDQDASASLTFDETTDLDLGGLDSGWADSEEPAYEPPSDIIMDRQAYNAGGMPISTDLGLGSFDTSSEQNENVLYEPPSEIILDDTDDFSLTSMDTATADESASISDEVAALFDEADMGFGESQSFGASGAFDESSDFAAFDEGAVDLEPFSTEPTESTAYGTAVDPSLEAEVANLFAEDVPEFDTAAFDDAGLTFEDEAGVTADITPGYEEPLFGGANFGAGAFEDSSLVELETREENPVPEDFDLAANALSEGWPAADEANLAAETDIPLGDPDLAFGETVPLGESDLSFGSDETNAAPLFEADLEEADLNAAFAADLTGSSTDADWVGEDSALESDLDLNLDLQTLDLEPGFDAEPSPTENWATDAAIADFSTSEPLERNGMVADEPYEASLFEDALLPDLDLSGLELDDSALNDFADSSAEDERPDERFGLTSGDLGGVDSASGVVLDLDAALSEPTNPDLLTFDTELESGLPPTELTQDAQPSPVDAPEAIAAADALAAEMVAPIADFSPISPEQDISDDWAASPNLLIDENELLFDIDENALDNSTFTTSGDLDNEIILTPNVYEAEGSVASPSESVPTDPSLALAATPEMGGTPDPSLLANREEPDAYGEGPAGVVPPPPDEPGEPEPTQSAGKRGWLALISLLIGLWLLGILAVTLFRRNPEPAPVATQSPGAPADPASPGATPPPPAASTGNPLQDGLARGASAANLAQTAQSADDWGLVASQWQQAIALFQSVPESSPDYATAQQKITEYQQYLAVAQQRVASIPPVTETPPTAPALIVSDDVSCQAIATNEDSPQLELSNVQLSGATGSPVQLIGCLTNHTEQPINAVSVVYQQSNTDTPGAAQQGLGRLDIGTIQPGETLPFRSDFTLAGGTNQATIQSLLWNSPNAREPQKQDVQISAALE